MINYETTRNFTRNQINNKENKFIHIITANYQINCVRVKDQQYLHNNAARLIIRWRNKKKTKRNQFKLTERSQNKAKQISTLKNKIKRKSIRELIIWFHAYVMFSVPKLDTIEFMKFSRIITARIDFQSVAFSPSNRQIDSSANLTTDGGFAIVRTSTSCCLRIDFTAVHSSIFRGIMGWLIVNMKDQNYYNTAQHGTT